LVAVACFLPDQAKDLYAPLVLKLIYSAFCQQSIFVYACDSYNAGVISVNSSNWLVFVMETRFCDVGIVCLYDISTC